MRTQRVGSGVWGVVTLLLALACRPSARPPVRPSVYDPAHDVGALFADVQLSGIFSDSKEFVDAKPKAAAGTIQARYDSARRTPGFVLKDFVAQNFVLPEPAGAGSGNGRPPSGRQAMVAHINALWPVLTRQPDSADASSSLIPLPHPYVVPGGRFREIYYWDSYFTMQGLVKSGRTDLVKNMLDNFAHLVRTVGHIPNGNRTYYLSRSQPPYFAAMVALYAGATDTAQALPYLDALEKEHAFWMDGAERLQPGQYFRRVVRMPDGVVLNRYWDDSDEPRPESYRPDVEIGMTLPDSVRPLFYRNVRASAESGWDFSSRWMRDPKDLRTLETVDLIPVDLNALLYNAEQVIAALRTFRMGPGDEQVARRFLRLAAERRLAIQTLMYDPPRGFFYDVRWRTGERVLDRPSLAAAAPLYFGIATPEQGVRTAAKLEAEFLKPGGFVTTNFNSGQQWDGPNGWPPLEWLTIEGVRRYQRDDLAERAASRWLNLIQRTYRTTGRMMEKYDVINTNRKAGGGEYPTQDGFGWTNGVALALCAMPAQTRTCKN
ncbi:MAG TPA: alpha,alpha-trehalase TreF [Gemmatimonadales bacterium]|nr:alpha,alpha-trehalase TreF [Gemmatimonadales bacterium]